MIDVYAACIKVSGQEICDKTVGINNISDIVNKIMPVIMTAAGIILFFVLVWGGYNYMMSQGNPEKIKGAQAKITTGIIGFILLIAAYAIVKLLSTVFGLGQGIF